MICYTRGMCANKHNFPQCGCGKNVCVCLMVGVITYVAFHLMEERNAAPFPPVCVAFLDVVVMLFHVIAIVIVPGNT